MIISISQLFLNHSLTADPANSILQCGKIREKVFLFQMNVSLVSLSLHLLNLICSTDYCCILLSAATAAAPSPFILSLNTSSRSAVYASSD